MKEVFIIKNWDDQEDEWRYYFNYGGTEWTISPDDADKYLTYQAAVDEMKSIEDDHNQIYQIEKLFIK